MLSLLKITLLSYLVISRTAADNLTLDAFQLPVVTTHQPNGNPDGQVNYYSIGFNVTSTNGDSSRTAWCWTLWADNGDWGDNEVAYSTAVPSGEWLPCSASLDDLGESDGGNLTTDFSFQLFQHFSIGDFSVAVQQNFTQSIDNVTTRVFAQSDPYQITNATASYICTIDPTYVQYEEHCSGDCSTPTTATGFVLPIASTTSCIPSTTAILTFPVSEVTQWGDEVFVSGNISELGEWDPYNAVRLSAAGYSAGNNIWQGGNVKVAAGTAFEYKYLQWNADGTLLWECNENRTWLVDVAACGELIVGDDPDWFRCGGH